MFLRNSTFFNKLVCLGRFINVKNAHEINFLQLDRVGM